MSVKYKMFIEKNVIKLAVVLVSCDLIRFRLSVNGRESSPRNPKHSNDLWCLVYINAYGDWFLSTFSNDTVIYSMGWLNLNKENIGFNINIKTGLGPSQVNVIYTIVVKVKCWIPLPFPSPKNRWHNLVFDQGGSVSKATAGVTSCVWDQFFLSHSDLTSRGPQKEKLRIPRKNSRTCLQLFS